ncbi:unnamed protein product, partial [marine sediment metagenome]
DNNKIVKNTDKASSFGPFWKNTNVFSKCISHEIRNPFKLNTYGLLFDSIPHLKACVLNNPFIFLSDKVYPINKLPEYLDENTDQKNLYLSESIYNELLNTKLKSTETDTAYIIYYSPNQIIARTKSNNSQIISLLQSNYMGWKVYIDEKLVPHFTSNYLIISSLLPKGEHIVKFKYSNMPVLAGFIISYVTFGVIILLIVLIFAKRLFKKYNINNIYLLSIPVIFCIPILLYFFKKPYIQKQAKTFKEF